MAITSAAIEANGWVLVVTLTGSLSAAGDFSGYTLDPNGTPRLVVTSTAPGFAVSGGTAVIAATARSLIATKPLRLPVQATAAGARSAKTPDETNLGGGTIRLRIALSQHVYATDTALTLTALGGWRTGEGAATIAVTNGSRIGSGDANMPPLPSPIVRWSDVPYQRIAATTLIPLEVVAFAPHPNGVAPIAGVRFTVTDGTNTASAWATALSSSPKYAAGGTGVAARVYRVVVDGTTATPAALTEGLIRCDFKAFPWIGQARSSNTLDTTLSVVASSTAPSMTSLGTAGMAPAAQVPFVYAYDPANTWTPTLYIYVEPNTWIGTGSITSNVLTVATTTSGAVAVGTKISGVGTTPGCTVVSGAGATWTVTATANVGTIALQGGGTTNNNIATVSSNPATAAAGICCAAIDTARNAIVVQNRTTGARNGQPAIGPKASDGIIVRVKAGTYPNLGTTGVGSGIASSYSWDIIEGDPADSNPRANVVVTIPAAAPTLRLNRVAVRNLTLLGTGNAGPPLATGYGWADNCEINGGGQSNNITIFNTTAVNTWWTNTRYWRISTAISGQLARNCQVENTISSVTALNNARLAGSFVGSAGVGSPGSAVDPFGATQDVIAAGNDLRYISGAKPWSGGTTPAANAGATALGTAGYVVFNRQVFANNVCEMYGASSPLTTPIGENASTVATWGIIEGNTLLGDRTNLFYDDLNLATIAANDTESNIMLCNRVANNVFDQHSTKHDFFFDPVVATGDPASKFSGRVGVALGTSWTRSWVVAVGAELVIAGSPAKVYRCSQAGTTASTGGPSGTGTAIVDGTAKWDFFANETRQHGYRPQSVRGWSALYGVGMVDNVILRGNTNPEFVHEFEGLNTPNYTVDTGADADPKFVADKSGSTTAGVRYNPANTGGGNYKPLPGSPLIAHGRSANVDIDWAGVTRSIPFASGAVQNDTAVALAPAGAVQATRASTPVVGLSLAVTPRAGTIATRAASSGVGWSVVATVASARSDSRAADSSAGWATILFAASARSASRAAAPLIGWAAVLTAASTVIASRASASLTGWATVLRGSSASLATQATAAGVGWATALGAASATLATRATSGVAAWATALLPDVARMAIGSIAGRIDWLALLIPANARSISAATAGGVGIIPPGALAPDPSRVAIRDRTLPTLLPGSIAPPERTLTVTGDFRAVTIPAD